MANSSMLAKSLLVLFVQCQTRLQVYRPPPFEGLGREGAKRCRERAADIAASGVRDLELTHLINQFNDPLA